MNFLKEKGIPLEKQLRTWYDIVKRPYNRHDADCYTRTRQILMNGIETEAWGFKHCMLRKSDDVELNQTLAQIRRIEDMQQTTVNWLSPPNQTVLDTTLGYEQVAVDLTAWLSQNEDDSYVKETFDFGLLEDFDHLYRYSQFSNMIEEVDPDEILHNMTDVMVGRPTQYHHNCNALRLRKPYDKTKATPKTKVNILTLLSGEQQTHNYYAEHGFMYGNTDLKRLYAEICDVEEEHVTMYETLIDPTETFAEKWLTHELTEVCNYHNCYVDEVDKRMKLIWEEMFKMELTHLQIAAQYFEKTQNKDPLEIIGDEKEQEIYPCHFESQKAYVQKVLDNEADKRIDKDGTYNKIADLESNWASYEVQKAVLEKGAPCEHAIKLSISRVGRDIAIADDNTLAKQPAIIEKSLEKIKAPDSVSAACYEKFSKTDPKIYLY